MAREKISREEFVRRMKRVKLLALDVDGVLTDDNIYFGPDGFEMKQFNISDGFFIVLAMRAGLEVAIVSGRYSPATDTRMKDLGVKHVLQGMKDKVEMIEPLLDSLNILFSEIAFVGNEILDIKLARRAGLAIASANAADRYKEEVDFVTRNSGGQGAVREVLEYYFEAVGKNPESFVV